MAIKFQKALLKVIIIVLFFDKVYANGVEKAMGPVMFLANVVFSIPSILCLLYLLNFTNKGYRYWLRCAFLLLPLLVFEILFLRGNVNGNLPTLLHEYSKFWGLWLPKLFILIIGLFNYIKRIQV